MRRSILTHSEGLIAGIRKTLANLEQNTEISIATMPENFSHGPLNATGDVAAFWKARQTYWRSFEKTHGGPVQSFDCTDRFQKNIDVVEQSDEIEIWVSHTVMDQIHLTVILHLLELEGVNLSHCKVRFITSDEALPGLDCISAEKLTELVKLTRLTEIDLNAYREAWSVVSSNRAEDIERFVNSRNPAEPIAIALRAYLLRFPACNGGVGSMDRALLSAGSEEMRKTYFIIGSAMAYNYPTIDQISDGILTQRLIELSKDTVSPWFEIEGDMHDLRHTHARLTESGKRAREKYNIRVL